MTFDLHEQQSGSSVHLGYLHTKFVAQATFPYSDIVFTKFQVFDLCWPQMTFEIHEKQNIYYLLTKYYLTSPKGFEVQFNILLLS